MSAGMTDPAIAVEGLTKRYGDRTVVDDVSLEVSPGEVVVLLGPNGAGKTTTVEIMEGYRRGDGGSVRVLGVDPWDAGRAHRARVGLMLQAGGIDLRARPAETLHQFAAFHADPLDPDALIDELGLRVVATTPYRHLSGGERQRLGFALALVGRPDVLLLDEPTAGMDPEARAAVRARIDAGRAAGTAVLVTTHELADAERIADRIIVMAAGRVVAEGTPIELASRRAPRLRFSLERDLDAQELGSLSAAMRATVRGAGGSGRYLIDATPPSPALVAALASWCEAAGVLIVESSTADRTLEEAYLALIDATGSTSEPET
jgi:ABC-2 type transport system ATP-binding protein